MQAKTYCEILGLIDSERELEWGHRCHLAVNGVQPPARYLASGIHTHLTTSPLPDVGIPGGRRECCSMAAPLFLSWDVEYLEADLG